MKSEITKHGFTSVKLIQWQPIEGNAVISPAEVFRIQTGTFSSDDRNAQELRQEKPLLSNLLPSIQQYDCILGTFQPALAKAHECPVG